MCSCALPAKKDDKDDMDVTPELPEGFAARPPEDADRPAIHEVVAACGIADYGTPDEALIDAVEMTWNKPGFVRATDAWAVLAPDGRVAAYAHIGPADRAHRYAHAFVHPDLVGRGLGSWLLACTEARAGEQARQGDPTAAAGAGEAATMEQWIGATNRAARVLLSAAGYAEVRHFWGMVISLDVTPAPPALPAGITIRACGDESDRRRAHMASEDAFRDHWHYEPRGFEQFMADQTATERYDPALWLLALEGDEPVGTALCEAYPARGWINTVGVRPAWRRRGIATALLRHAFAEFLRRGLREAGLGVDAQNSTGATRVYERAGMRVERQYDVFEKEV